MQKIKTDVEVVHWDHLDWQVDGTGILMAYSAVHPADSSMAAIKEIASIRGLSPAFMMINRVPPGVSAPPHTDTLPFPVERWHLPLVTNREAYWWDEEKGFLHFQQGFWYGPVPYNIRHAIVNFGLEERIHLVVDLQL